MQKSTMESASWQRPLYGFEISQNQAGIPLKSGVLGRPGGGILFISAWALTLSVQLQWAIQSLEEWNGQQRFHAFFMSWPETIWLS